MSNYLVINITSSKTNFEKVETKIRDYYLKKNMLQNKISDFF